MPTPLEFMERVLPWPEPSGSGWGNLHWHLTTADGKKLWRGAPYKTAEELVSRAQKLTMQAGEKAADIFYCTSLQADTENIRHGDRSFVVAARHANTACAIKAIWLDVDVKAEPKGYPTKKEALDAISKFCADANLPGPSALVFSGGGVHVYWFSDRTLSVAEWAPFAEGLKAEAMRLGLRADYGVTTDAARILRVPGTFNRKIAGTPRPVKVVGLGSDYTFATDLAHLAVIGGPRVTATVTKPAPFDLSAFQGQKMHPLLAAALASATDKLSDGIDRYSDLPLDPTEVIKGCPHFTDAAVNRGQGHGQGLWMLTVLASTWFEDGKKWAKRFSDKYPTFDQDEFDAMWARKLDDRAKGVGWPSCKSFENEGCKHCATCIYKPQGRSPLNLAERVKPPDPPPTPQVVTNPITNVSLTEADLNLPDGYCLHGGLICKRVNIQEDDKEPPEYEYIPVFIGEVISKPKVSASRPPTLYFKYRQGLNYTEVVVPYPAYATDQALATVFLEAGILTDPRSDKFVRLFMRSWVGRIDLAFKRLNTAPLGWIIENGNHTGFAYGGTLFHKDGSEEDSGVAGDWFQKFIPSGDPAPVLKAIDAISQQMNPALEVLTLQSWASPLVDIAGLKTTAIVWGYSNLSGKGKSMSLRTGMALWGAPDKCRDRGGATAIGMENKMDRLQNLPAQIDELKDHSKIDDVAAIFERIGEGGQGAKATRNGGLRPEKFWQLILTCGSNTSLYQYQAKKGQSTDAGAMRGFEVRVEDSPVPSQYTMTEIDQLVGSLEHNYGHLGLRYAKYLAMNREKIDARYLALDKQTIADLTPPNRTGLPNEERFWKTTTTLTILAAELANEVIGKDYFHVDLIRDYLYSMYREHRAWVIKHVTIAGSGLHTEEAWNKLMNIWINDQLITDKMSTGGAGRSSVPVQVYVHPPYERGHFTKIHWLQEPPLVRIAYTSLVDDLKVLDMSTEVVDRFEKLYGGKRERKTFLAGVPVPETKTRITVWDIPITLGHPLYRQWAEKVRLPEPANMASAEAAKQDAAPPAAAPTPAAKGFAAGLAAGLAQAAKDAAAAGVI